MDEARLYLQREEFLGLVREGIMPFHAAIEVGWTPRAMQTLIKNDHDFAELYSAALEQRDESIEETLLTMAKGKHFGAVQMWLYNKRPDRWADRKQIDVKTEGIMVHVIDTAREALKETLLAGVNRQGVIAALQPGGILDVEEADGRSDA